MRDYTKEEIEIFKKAIKDYRIIEKDINDRIEKGYKIEDLYDYIRHLSSCNITNYNFENNCDKYFDFNYCDMCLRIYGGVNYTKIIDRLNGIENNEKDEVCCLGDLIEVWNDKEGYLIDYTSIKDLEQVVKEMMKNDE